MKVKLEDVLEAMDFMNDDTQYREEELLEDLKIDCTT